MRSCADLALALESALPFEGRVGFCELDRPELPSGTTFDVPPAWGEKRRRDFLAGREAARLALEKLGVRGEVGRDPSGVPLFPSGTVGSITHTGRQVTRAFSLVATGADHLGIDAEEVRELDLALRSYIADDSELDGLLRAQVRPDALAIAAFCAKEAFYKCVFPELRRFVGFKDVVIQCEPHGTNRWNCVLTLKSESLARPGTILVSGRLVLCAVWNPTAR